MNSALIIGVVFGILGIVLMVFLVIVAVVFIIGLFQGWKKGSRRRQANAEAQRRRRQDGAGRALAAGERRPGPGIWRAV